MLMLNDYLPLQPLGNGATGIVFLVKLCSSNTKDGSQQLDEAQQQQQQRLFAVKAFRKSRAPDLQRSHNEEQVLSKLQSKHHAFLPHLHSVFEEGEFRFLVLDYCPGGDLNSLRHSLPEKRFTSAAIRFYAAEVVLALEHLHEEGVLYRDLKPENIMLSSNGHVMLTDFDLSAALPPKNPRLSSLPLPDQQARPEQEEDTITSFTCLGGACSGGAGIHQRRRLHPKRPLDSHRVMPAASVDLQELVGPTNTARSHSFVGTEEYVAPEIILGTGHELAVDWWALGVLLYEMAYGTTPFRGLTAKETFHNILHKEARFPGSATNPLQDLIRKLLVKEPHRRLGYCYSAAEIKAHPFFASLQWEALEDVLRPPFIPTEPEVDFTGFDLKSHLVEVECARAEARSNRKLLTSKQHAQSIREIR